MREALELMRLKGYLCILITNQSDVGWGNIAPDEFERIMAIFAALGFDDLFACKHRPTDGCGCRKPEPGLILSAAKKHGLDLPLSYMMGDMWFDVAAGKAAGTRTILVANPPDVESDADHRAIDLLAATHLLP